MNEPNNSRKKLLEDLLGELSEAQRMEALSQMPHPPEIYRSKYEYILIFADGFSSVSSDEDTPQKAYMQAMSDSPVEGLLSFPEGLYNPKCLNGIEVPRDDEDDEEDDEEDDDEPMPPRRKPGTRRL